VRAHQSRIHPSIRSRRRAAPITKARTRAPPPRPLFYPAVAIVLLLSIASPQCPQLPFTPVNARAKPFPRSGAVYDVAGPHAGHGAPRRPYSMRTDADGDALLSRLTRARNYVYIVHEPSGVGVPSVRVATEPRARAETPASISERSKAKGPTSKRSIWS
jgi:hypothetical protein